MFRPARGVPIIQMLVKIYNMKWSNLSHDFLPFKFQTPKRPPFRCLGISGVWYMDPHCTRLMTA